MLLVTFFPKNQSSDLTPAEKKEISRIIRETEEYLGRDNQTRTKG